MSLTLKNAPLPKPIVSNSREPVRLDQERHEQENRGNKLMELEMIKLYGAPSTRALRVIWLLNELGLKTRPTAPPTIAKALAAAKS